jgi:TetR/AcrR family transcriptional regulator, transcriptional repressor for nem operon
VLATIDYSGTIVLVSGMPRAKEFDEAEVLDQALEMFRARGFKHTSFDDLTDGLGVSRQSLYDTYGDKNALYHAALKRYLDRSLDQMGRKLADPAPIRKVLGGFFEAMLAGVCSKGSPGCPMVNSMVEQAPHEADIRALAQTHARSVQDLFEARLAAARRKGEISRSKDPAALARFFYHTMLGFGVATRALGDPEPIRSSIRIALQALD